LNYQDTEFSHQADRVMEMIRDHQGDEIRRDDDLTMVGFRL